MKRYYIKKGDFAVKKKLMAMVMVVFTAIMMIGCSQTGLSLMDELNKMYAWEAMESTAEIVIDADIDGEKFKAVAEVTSYNCTKDATVEGVMTLKTLEIPGVKLDLTSGQSKINPIKVVMKDGNIYFSKSYFEDIFSLIGQDVSSDFENITSEYIGLKYDAVDISEAGIKQYMDLYKNMNADVEIVQDGRTYTVDLNDEEIVDLFGEFMDDLYAMDVMKETMIATGELTEEDYAAFQEELSTQMAMLLPELKTMLKGSSAKVTYAFDDDSLKSSTEVNVAAEMDGEKVTAKITATQVDKKVAKKEVNIPAGTKVYTMEEFTELCNPTMALVLQDELVVKGNVIYVPLKDTMEQLNIPVKFDSKTKTTSLVIDGKERKITTKLIDGTSYVTPATFKALGYTYEVDEDGDVWIY